MAETAHFRLTELDAATQGGRASAAARTRFVDYWAPLILEPARRALGFPIIITSADRAFGGPAHRQGDASALDLGVAGNDAVQLEALFQWLATYKAGELGRIIHERDHVHVTRPGPEDWAGRGVVLREPTEGSYVLASILPSVPAGVTGRAILLAAALGAALSLVLRG